MDVLTIGNLIIDNLEGGYYHPDMYQSNPDFFTPTASIGAAYARSGETMFGFDRVNGGSLNQKPKMVEFWAIIDANYTPHHGDLKWWNEMAGYFRTGKPSGIPLDVQKNLRRLASEQMAEQLNYYASLYLDPAAYQVVLKDPRLLLQFLYACWNGPGNFKKFAEVINKAYGEGTRKANALYDLVQAKRVQILPANAAAVDALANTLSNPNSKIWWLLAIAGGLVAYHILKR